MTLEDKRRYARDLLNFLPAGTTGSLLDVGCGTEQILVQEAKRRGFEATGIDPLVNTDLEHFRTRRKFDVIVLKHVLEHIANLDSFLSKCFRLLKDGGYLLVACPNIKSLMFFLFRKRWYGLQPDQHLWQFTPELLKAVLERNNFRIVKAKINNLDYQVKGLKGIIFFFLLTGAQIFSAGDQLVFLAKKS